MNLFNRVANDKTPVYVQHNVEFVVDTTKLGDWRDVKVDLIPDMKRKATKQFYYVTDIDGELRSANQFESHEYKVTRFVYSHGQTGDFHKVIITVTEGNDGMNPLVYIKYYFDSHEHAIDTKKEGKNNRKTLHSTRKRLLETRSNVNKKGKNTFHKVSDNIGGFENA